MICAFLSSKTKSHKFYTALSDSQDRLRDAKFMTRLIIKDIRKFLNIDIYN